MINKDLDIIKTNKELTGKDKIIFFDGVCNVCNGFVDFVLRYNYLQNIYFASLQSSFAKEFLKQYDINTNDLNTIYFIDNGILFNRSAAALQITNYLQKPFSFLKLFQIIPRAILDAIYNFTAKNRYQFFGKRDTCRIPDEKELERFLS